MRPVARLGVPGRGGRVLPLERVAVDGTATLAPGFAILVVVSGEVRLGDLSLPRGRTVVVPNAAGAIVLTGAGEVLACRPPAS